MDHRPNTVAPGGAVGTHRRSVLSVANSTATAAVFAALDRRFDRLLAHRAFVHWYAREGFEADQLAAAREDTAQLAVDYAEAVADPATDDDDEDEY
jgi:tubulin alpha